MQDYTLSFFIKNYLEARGIAPRDKTAIEEAFYAGAHTLYMMMLNALRNDNTALMKSIGEELDTFMAVKELECKDQTIH